MEPSLEASLLKHFSKVKDPRVEYLVEHKFIDILTIAICAVIAGADNWVEVEQFGREKQDWFAHFLELPDGIPTHDTFGRAFAQIDAEQFKLFFRVGAGRLHSDRPTGSAY